MASLAIWRSFSIRLPRFVCRANYEGDKEPMSIEEFQKILRSNANYQKSLNSLHPNNNPTLQSRGSRSAPSRSTYPALFSKYSENLVNKVPKGSKARNSYQNQSRLSYHTDLSDTTSLTDDEIPERSATEFSNQSKGKQRNKGNGRAPLPLPVGDPETAPADPPPFEFQYSYTETPKVDPIGYREPQFSPFGPVTMSRPWTGGPPMKKSKKNRLPKILPEFDSFNLPTKQKGVKKVEAPGPYKGGEGPKYVRNREEIIGEPLTRHEIKELVEECIRGNRQVNLGRDGLVHNMLDLIHTHWKRRRVCKIKCKGVPTVDMDNVCRQVEEKTGGVIIHRQGGVIYLFRGRNYNYKLRPRFPLMLWKPAAPIYPRLIQDAPPGLTRGQANELRKIGRKLKPFCKLGKNGVYIELVKLCKEEFLKNHELIKVDCKGLEPSDYKKIGAKLRDLVPCVLLSFEREQILMWKGRADNEANTNQNEKGNSLLEYSGKLESVDVTTGNSSTFSNAVKMTETQEDEETSAASDVDNEIGGSGLIVLDEDDGDAEKSEIDATLRIVNDNMLKEKQEKGNIKVSSKVYQSQSKSASENRELKFENSEKSEINEEYKHLKTSYNSALLHDHDLDSLWDDAVRAGEILPLDVTESNGSSPKSIIDKDDDKCDGDDGDNGSDILWEKLNNNLL